MTTTEITQEQISTGRMRQAQAIFDKLGETLVLRGLENTLARLIVARDPENGQEWAACVHDMKVMGKLEAYQTPEVLHHLSTALKGTPVFTSNDTGLRYLIPLQSIRELPKVVPFPGVQRGYLLLGQNYSGQPVRLRWNKLEHMLVGGMTGGGKSSFLQLLIFQALAEGCQLMLADIKHTSFKMLAESPQLIAPLALEVPEVIELVDTALGECRHREALYDKLRTYPESLDEYNAGAVKAGLPPLPRLLVILDEFNATITDAGGPKSPFAGKASSLGCLGRQFGVHVIFAAQDFAISTVGRLRNQVGIVVCFRVRTPQIADAMGCRDAAKMTRTRPGLAFTDRWDYMQAYLLDKAQLIAAGETTPAPALTPEEQSIVQRALTEDAGKITQALVEACGMGQRAARRLLEEWELRGWIKKDPTQKNARVITPKMRVLLTN